jgi:outer membrane protein assembly factor BamB
VRLEKKVLQAILGVFRGSRPIVLTVAIGLVPAVALTADPIQVPLAAAKTLSVTAPTYVWTEFHHNAQLTGLSGDPTFSTRDAGTLGVKWMSPIAVDGSLESPVAAWDPVLQMTIAYLGTSSGNFDAIDVADGQIVWSDYLGASETSSPLIENGNVWTTADGTHRIYKLNANTGATECIAPVTNSVDSSPILATPPDGVPTVYFASIGWGKVNGPVTAYSESTCSPLWSWSSYGISGVHSGAWSPLNYTVDAAGVGLLLFGSADPDSAVYALNAQTGALVWRYQTYEVGTEDWDVGAGVVTTAPGVNGFADGVAYVNAKDGILYALDLATGAMIWQFNFDGNAPGNPTITNSDSMVTPAISGTTLVFGDNDTLFAVDALTGSKEWSTHSSTELKSSPAIVGPPGQRVVVYGDMGGIFHVVKLSTGASLYVYRTGGYITSSPADVEGNLLIASSDGFLYDFALDGGNGSTPTTSIASPTTGSSIVNPDGSVVISGTASTADGVQAVDVQIQINGPTGPWYQQSTSSFAQGLGTAQATLASPGATTTTWSLAVPVPLQGGALAVSAMAVGSNAVADGTAFSFTPGAAADQFSVLASPLAPQVSVSAPRVPPGGNVTVSATGFAAGEQVAFTAPVSSDSQATLATVTAGPTGAIPAAELVIPSSTPFGPDPITATGQTSGLLGYTSVYVANDDPQVGYNPQHTGAEANDHVITDYQPVNNSTKLSQQWGASGNGAFDTTPAISQGVIYIGDEAGTLSAFGETNGETLFTADLGSPIESSPAVDSGEVFVGDEGGDLSAFNASTGVPIWTDTIGGNVPTPTVYDGTVYVGSQGGDVFAINEVTGTIVWTASMGSPVSSAPAIDPASGNVIATTQSGVVEALSRVDGTELWSDPVGGALTGPMIYRGDVYVGSSTGSLDVMDVGTGASAWSVDTGSAISVAPIITLGNTATVATAAGTLSYYDASTGALINTQTFANLPITGLSCTGGLVLITSTYGLRLISAPYYPDAIWSLKGGGIPAFPAAGVLLNGDVFAAGADGLLRAFSIPGRGIV